MTTTPDYAGLIERLESIPTKWVDGRLGKEAATALRTLLESKAALERGLSDEQRANASLLETLTASQTERDRLAERVGELEKDIEARKDEAVERAELISAPEDEIIRPLCERIGYGAVMDSAARLWAKKDPMGAFYIGGCIGLRAARSLVKGGGDAE